LRYHGISVVCSTTPFTQIRRMKQDKARFLMIKTLSIPFSKF